MPESTTYTVANIIAMTKGETPWFDKVSDGWRHLKNAQDDISNLSAGSAPGWNAAIDTRWYISDTSTSATTYTGATSPSATSNALQAGYRILFDAANNNTGAATLNVGSTDGAVDIKKIASGAKAALDANDMDSDTYCDFVYDGTDWVMLNPPTGYTSPLTTKGDLFQRTSSADSRLAVGGNTTVLTADSTEATGMKWSTPYSSPLTTKGDVLGYSTTNARLGAGTNGYTLTAQSAQSTGLLWAQLGTAGIADDAVTSAKIADGTIATADIANDAVTLAKMDDTGTAGYALRASGSGTNPTWARNNRLVNLGYYAQDTSGSIQSTTYVDSGYAYTYTKLEASSDIFVEFNFYLNNFSTFSAISDQGHHIRLIHGGSTVVTPTDIVVAYMNPNDSAAFEIAGFYTLVWKTPTLAAAEYTFEIQGKSSSATDGGFIVDKGFWRIWEIDTI